MTRKRSSGVNARVAVLSAVVAATLLVTPLAMQGSRGLRQAVVDGRRVSADEVLVKFRRNLAGRERTRFDQDTDADEHKVVGGAGVHRIHSRSHDTKRLLELLRSHPDVSYAEPNYIVEADAAPDDPWFSEMWGLRNIGQRVGKLGTPGADISAPLAWDISTGSRANVVAVIDTGIDYSHPDLADNVWSAPVPFDVTIGGFTIHCPAGSHGFNAIANSCDPYDDNGHGSHVSGTIGAVGDNGTGVTGVNWTASLMASKFLDKDGLGTLADAIDAIEFVLQASTATGANVRILSNSWSAGGFSQALLDEINTAGTRNMLFVASAGNNTRDIDASPSYPASYSAPNLIAVASTDNTDILASNSNWGATSVHLAAPGVNILSTYTAGAYQYLSGTSMAAPHVSGAAALVLSHCALNTAALKSTLLAAVDPIPLLTGKLVTGGRLNVNAAIRGCGPDFSIAVTPAVQAATPGTGISYTVTVTPSGGMTGTVDFSVTGVPPGATATVNPASVTLPGSSTLTVTSGQATPAGTYPMTISAASGKVAHSAGVSYVRAAANQPPVAVADAATTVEDTPVAIAVLANDSDPDGDTLSLTAVDMPAHGTTSINPDKTISYSPAANYNGPDTFNYTIGDGAGNSASAAVTVMVTPANDPPVAANDSYNATEDTVLTVPAASGVLANDTDVDAKATLTASVVVGPLHGTLNLGPSGSFIYTPAADYNGSDSFTYKTSDGLADSNIATVAIAIAAVNDAPVANSRSIATDEDTAKAITLSATDIEGSSLTYAIVVPPSHGTLAGAAPVLTYTPAPRYSGPDSFAFKANDGAADSNVATVSITVNAVVNPDFTLSASPPAQAVTAGASASYTVTVSPTAGFVGSIVFSASGLPPGVTASFNPSSVTTSGSSTLTLTSATSTPPGGFPITVVGTSGSKIHSGAVNLVVQAAVLAVDQIVFSDGAGARTTPTFSTVSAPETLIAFAAADGPSAGGQTLAVTGAGLTWSLVKRVNTEAGTAEIWRATAPAVLSNVTVKSTPALTGYKQSLTVVTFVNAAGVGAVAGASARTGAPAVSLTTTQAGSLVYALGNDWDDSIARTLPADQTMVHQWVDTTVGDTFWLQAGIAPVALAGTLVQVADTAPKTDRWNFAAVEIVSAKAPAVGVPNVVKQTEATAAAAIVTAGLTVGPVTYVTSTTVAAGTIISQSPVAGTQVVPGTPVSLVASSGPPVVAVPDVAGLTQAAASAAITSAGLAVGAITTASSTMVPAGAIISQTPIAGTQIVVGSAVALVVSSGLPLVAVPNVVSSTKAAATTAITSLGLTLGTVTTASSATVPAGSVISQNPAAGTLVISGTAVAFVVSSGPASAIAIDQIAFADGRGTQNARISISLPGEIVVAFVSSDGASTGGQTTTVSGAGLSWTLVQRANTQAGSAEIWKATAPTALANVTVTSTQSQGGYDQSLTVVAFSGASAIGASAKQSSATGAASATVTTTKANAWVFGVGNDWEEAIPRVLLAGQAMIHQWVDASVGDTFWVQSSGTKITNAGTSVRLGVTSPTADRWNFAVVEIVP